jgi:hypothetical protein
MCCWLWTALLLDARTLCGPRLQAKITETETRESSRLQKQRNTQLTAHSHSTIKTCRENSSLINIWQEQRIFYMKTYVHIIISRWSLLRMKNTSDNSCRENQNGHFTFNNFFRKSCSLWDNVEKYGTPREATDENMKRHMHIECWKTNVTNTHSENAGLSNSFHL